MVGRLAPWKGQHVFLRAFAQAFPEGNAEARIVGAALFGEQQYADELLRLAGQLGIRDRVDFRGFREDVSRELAELDMLVHCSVIPEPFGMVVIEGMAAGVPVIAAGSGGPAEVISQGVDGLLVAPDDVSSLAATMRRLGDDPGLRASLSAAGRKTARIYSPENAAAGVMRVYDTLVSDHGRTRRLRLRHR
jgi:glycosyltransferase involved in cell wall biosynthesis